MKKILSVALVWIVFGFFALSFLLVMPGLQAVAEKAAREDLTSLTDAAFELMALSDESCRTAETVADQTVLTKARAVARMLAHDDTLLSSDGLNALQEQLALSRIDVIDYEGVLVASTDPARIGTTVSSDDQMTFVSQVMDEPGMEAAQGDNSEAGLRWGCVNRMDTDGVILVTGMDAALAAAKTAATPEETIRRMSFIRDTLQVTAGGEDGAQIVGEYYTVQNTQNGVSLLAQRALSSVYLTRNLAAMILSSMMILGVCAAIVIQLLLRRQILLEQKLAKRKHKLETAAPILPEEAVETEDQPMPQQEQESEEAETVLTAEEDGQPIPDSPAPNDAASEETENTSPMVSFGKRIAEKLFTIVEETELDDKTGKKNRKIGKKSSGHKNQTDLEKQEEQGFDKVF